ncbi:MAG: hypothetical protein WD227_12155, partial [Vicinamibacterales bacterium]
NRLVQAQRLVRDVNEGKRVLRADDETTLLRVAEAQWTILEQHIIARSLGRLGRTLPAALLAKLEMMLSGAGTEDEDRNPLARNTQFELYTRATLIMGDVPARIAEPDLRADYLGTEIGVAAKRVRSLRQLPKRTKEAVDQIRASALPGIVALNVDVLLKVGAADVINDEPLDERLLAIKQVDNTLAEQDCIVGSLVFARDTVWRFDGEKPAVGIATTHRFAIYPRTQQQREQGEEFWRRARVRIDTRLENL